MVQSSDRPVGNGPVTHAPNVPVFDRIEDGVFERRFRSLFDNTPYLIFTVSFDLRLTWVNDSFVRIFGFTEQEAANMPISQIVDAQFLGFVSAKIEKRRAGSRGTTPIELLAYTKTGETVWVEVSAFLVQEQGRPVEVQCIARDITAQRAAERSLVESERRFRETAELLPGIICEMDLTGRFTYVNRAALESFGYSHEDLERGVNVIQLVSPTDRERAAENVRALAMGEARPPTTYVLNTKQGEAHDMLVSSAPLLKDGMVCGVRTCLLDISDLRRAERLLKESEERFRKIFNESPVGVALSDRKGQITATNPAFADMFVAHGGKPSAGVFEFACLTGEEQLRTAGERGLESEGWCECGAPGGEPRRRYLRWHITPLSPYFHADPELLVQVQDITEQKEAEEERLRNAQRETEKAKQLIRSLRDQITERSTFNNMVSRSKEMKEIFELLPQVAETDVTVLVWGESGTGKELVAKSLHELSPRKDAPFVAINCSALPDTLLESELFGYKAGAFTDAKRDKPGKFALAEGGTLFLDEIGDISPAMQVKLLRVLQERVYEPLGATKSVRADVRVIAATNKDLRESVEKGTFRKDLFYRINVLSVKLPPLRERKSDIPLLCDHFVKKFNAQYEREVSEISPEALEALVAYDYQGNIRELENVLEHAFVFCKGRVIGLEHLPREFRAADCAEEVRHTLANVGSFEDLERLFLQSLLAETGGNKLEAAKRLNVHKSTFFRKLKKLGVR